MIIKKKIRVSCEFILLFFTLINEAHAQSTILDEKLPLYEISSSIDLRGETVTLPNNSIVLFSGGIVKNGTIVFNDNTLKGKIRFQDCHFKGSVTNLEFNVMDYGADNKGLNDNALLFNELIKLKTVISYYGKKILLPPGNYRIDSPIVLLSNYDQPIDFEGVGPSSIITQYSDNTYIFKLYERQNVKRLSLKYKNFQPKSHKKAVALACKRSLMSSFSDLYIEGCHTAIGFIFKEDWDSTIGENSSLVNNYYNNIRLWSYSGYFINTMDRIDGGDSGSVFENIYISTSRNPNGVVPLGALYFGSSTATFNQLNLENAVSTSKYAQIYCAPYACIFISVLHVEGQKALFLPIISARDFSQVNVGLMQVENCSYPNKYWTTFEAANNSFISVNSIIYRNLSDNPFIRTSSCYQNSIVNIGNIINCGQYKIDDLNK